MYKIIQFFRYKGNEMSPINSIAASEDISSPKGKKLLDQYRDALRVKHYSPRTEDTYILWVKNFILYHNKRHPKEMGISEIGQFLAHLASEKEVSASTQNQAFSAILFLYRHVLHTELDAFALLE